MDNQIFFLTIGIPTYNRCEYLKELLPIIINQLQGINEVELLISDNDSTDETQVYVNSLNKDNIHIQYYKNDVNIGGDANFIKVVERAQGEYIWIFGDDELLELGALNQIIEVLKNFDPSLLILNEKNYNTKIKEDKLFANYSEFLSFFANLNAHYPLAHTLITANIFKKNLFNINLAYKYLLSNYGHMYAMISNLTQNSVYVLRKPTIKIRPIRATFADKIDNLLLKQSKYIFFLGKFYKNNDYKLYAFYFFIKKYLFQLLYTSLKKLHLLEIAKSFKRII